MVDTVPHLTDSLSLKTIYRKMESMLPTAASTACVPVSGYPVGAVVLGGSGAIYSGANIEFPGLPLNFTIHAEQAAVTNARRHGEKKVTALAVSALPCGRCRQFLQELRPAPDIIVGNRVYSLEELLPEAFRLETQSVSLLDHSRFPISKTSLRLAAIDAAMDSYSPYTGTKSGLAVQTCSGEILTGSLLESAAYNPSLSAWQTLICAGQKEVKNGFIHVVLAESGPCRLEPLLPALVQSVGSDANIEIIHLESET